MSTLFVATLERKRTLGDVETVVNIHVVD